MNVNTNLAMLVGQQGFLKAQSVMDQAMERLITGKRINRASDDPSGMIAADKLGARRVTIEEIIERAEFASHMLDAADGALGELSGLAQELSGLIVTAANRAGLSEGEREALQVEANGVIEGMRHLLRTTSFNGEKILIKGAGVDVSGRWIGVSGFDLDQLGLFQHTYTDENGDEVTASYTLDDLMNGELNLVDGDAEVAQKLAEAFAKNITDRRAFIGAHQKYALTYQVDTLRTEHENTAAAESAIRDADLAEEVSSFVRGQVLREASMTVMQIAQQQAKSALGLLG